MNAWGAALICIFGACQVGEDIGPEELDRQDHWIIGGDEASPGEYSGVVYVQIGNNACTGSLIADRVVLTAAHCLKAEADANDHTGHFVRFGNKAGVGVTEEIVRLFPHRYYTTGLFLGYDLALVRLKDPAPANAEIMVYNREPLSTDDVGKMARAVGFGVTNGEAQTGAGTKRFVDIPLANFDDEFVVLGTEDKNTCQGDSGGPLLMEVNNQTRIIGITAFGQQGCGGLAYKTRVDTYADLIDEVVAAWSGPCRQDGLCNQSSECGDYPDPDCDVCGLDYFCGKDCPRLDLDCPVVGMPGELCSENDGCESRKCVPAPEDDRVSFCSDSCDSAGCPSEIASCQSDGGEELCFYEGITPSVQGATCSSNGQCRSSNCDPEHQICVEPCAADGVCPSGFVCSDVNGKEACTLEAGGCCNSGGYGDLLGGILIVLATFVGRRTTGRRRVSAV